MNKLNTIYKLRTAVFLSGLLIFSCFTGCGNKGNDEFLLKGSLSNLESPYIFIATETIDSVSIDTIFVDKKGEFSYKNKVESLTMASLFFEKKSWAISIFADKGWKVNIKGDVNKPDLITVSGGEVNDDLTAFKKENESLFKTRAEIFSKLDSAATSEMSQNYDAELKNINFELINKARQFIENNPEKIASVVLIQDFYKNNTSIEALEEQLASLKGDAATFPLTRDLKQYSEKVKQSAVGANAPDFTLTENGKEIKLNDFKDKHLIITFSTNEEESLVNLPALIDTYKSLKDKDVEILSVIIDTEVREVPDSIQWKVFYDTKGWASEIVNSYNITQIPYSIFISPDGKIIGRGLSALPLMEKINQETEAR